MDIDLLASMLLFSVVTSISPGPNNIMAMASGTNFGFRRTLPHITGVSAGFALMIVIFGMGLISVFTSAPMIRVVLKILALAYFVWLAWKFANAAPPSGDTIQTEGSSPMTLLQAVAFQWVNPKAWAMAMAAITNYAPDQGITSVLFVAAAFALVSFPSLIMWTLMGVQIRRLLHRPKLLRIFNWTMAALLLASLIPVLVSV